MRSAVLLHYKKLLLAAAALLACALFVALGYFWGEANGRSADQYLSPKKAEAARELIAAVDPEAAADDFGADEDEPSPISRARYQRWLEEHVGERANKEATLAARDKQAQRTRLAQLVIGAAHIVQEVAPQDLELRRQASAAAVEVISEAWSHQYGESLELPAELYMSNPPRADVLTQARSADAQGGTPTTQHASSPGQTRHSATLQSIREAVAEFNRP